jgi:predicted ATPase/transcriptional regulator with XRE-family HTH domain
MNNPTDPQSLAAFTSFGALLLYLRRRARLRQRDLAVAVGYSEAQIGRLEHDQRTPDLAMVQAQFIPALGLDAEPALAERLIALAIQARAANPDTEEPRDPLIVPLVGHSLLPPTTPLLGRDDELAALAQLVRQAQYRCITLTGIGGVGKTRLALAVIERTAAHFTHGTRSIALADLHAADQVVPTLLRALGLQRPPSVDPFTTLCQHLHDKHMLLLLDNLEHLLEAAPVLSHLLDAAPQLWLLVTSREVLGLRHEQRFAIEGLPVAAPTHMVQSAAVQLFVLSAQRADRHFSPSVDDLSTIAQICTLVAGHPLAIELAAAWITLLTPSEIVHELRTTLLNLETRQRDLPPRHRSLSAAFDHSWHLLSPAEQCALRRLSMFHGSFTRAAAATVLAAEPGRTLPTSQVLALLATLADKSLLQQIVAHGESRYLLHELIRQHAAAHQHAHPADTALIQAAHGHYYLHLLSRHEAALRSPQQPQINALLDAESENIQAAVTWAVHSDTLEPLRAAFPALRDLIEWVYTLEEGWAWLTSIMQPLAALPTPTPVQQAVCALAMSTAGWFAHSLGRADDAATLLEQAYQRSANLVDAYVRGIVAWDYGSLLERRGDHQPAHDMLHRALAIFTAQHDDWHIARTLYALAHQQQQAGDYAEAATLLEAALHRVIAFGSPYASTLIRGRLGFVQARLGNYAAAEQLHQTCLLECTAVGDRRGMATTLQHLGYVAQHRDQHQEASYFFLECSQLFQEIGDRHCAAEALAQAAYAAVANADLTTAAQQFAAAWNLINRADLHAVTLSVLVCEAALLVATAQLDQALDTLTLVYTHPLSSEETRERAAALLAQVAPNC